MQDILDEFVARQPITEPEILATHYAYRKALMETELAFIAARLPNIIHPVMSDAFGSRRDRQSRNHTLAGHVDTVNAHVILSPEQKVIVKIWCRSLGVPIINWQAQLAEIRAADVSRIEEINQTSRQEGVRWRHLKTQEIAAQAYQGYRTKLLATAYGYLFNDLPSHYSSQNPASDWNRIDTLRRLCRQELKDIEESLSTVDGADYSALATRKLELGVRTTGLSVLMGYVRRSWDLGLDDRVRKAYTRLKKDLHGAWPDCLSPVVLQRLVEVRTGIKERLLEPQASTEPPESKNTHFLAALDEFFEVLDNPASFKPDAHDGAKIERSTQPKLEHPTNARAELVKSKREKQRQPESSASSPVRLPHTDVDALRQRVAGLRSKLFETPRDTSRDVIEDEIRRLKQSFKASSAFSTASAGGGNAAFVHTHPVRRSLDDGGVQSSTADELAHDHPVRRANSINITTTVGDDHNPRLLAGFARKKAAKDKHLQWKELETQGLVQNGNNTTQPQTTMESPVIIRKVFDVHEPPLPLDRQIQTKEHRDFEQSRQNLGKIVENMIPPKKSSVSFSSAISPMFDSQDSTSHPTPPASSDSADISDLKIQVAELKDLIRGLIFQQMAIPGTYSGPPMLASTKASLLAENSAPIAPVEKAAATTEKDTPAESKTASEKTTNARPPKTPETLEAPLKITYEMYPPDRDSQKTAAKESSQIVQYQTSRSLLAELFPEETKEVVEEDPREGTGSPARIPIPHVPLTPIDDFGADRRQSTGIVRRVGAKIPDMTPKSTVLELRYASKSLTEEDFRSLIPRGLHMQEWTQRGEFVKVIPKRDPWTLEQTGNYYIVFNNEEDAKAYKQHVSHVHDLAKQHTLTSLTSEIAPPPGYIINGEDVSGLVQSYALIPPQQKLFLQYLVPPFTPLQQNIFKRGGYAQILGEGREGVAQVLVVFLEGRQPSYFEISDAIHLDGKRRGLEWRLLPGETAIRKVDMREQQQKKKEEISLFERDFGDEGEMDALGDLEAEGGKRKRTVRDRAKTPTYGQRWILSFETVDEAKRFALQWHGRAFPWHDRAMRKRHGRGFGEQVLMVRAEFLW